MNVFLAVFYTQLQECIDEHVVYIRKIHDFWLSFSFLFIFPIQKDKNLYYICYIDDIIEKISIVC